MNGYRLATVLFLSCIAHGAAAQTNPAPRDEASCLAGIRMNDARRAYIDEWVQINRFRAPSTAGESDADWTARHRAATACGRRDIWVQEDQAENWRRQVIALPDERQRQLWAEFNS